MCKFYFLNSFLLMLSSKVYNSIKFLESKKQFRIPVSYKSSQDYEKRVSSPTYSYVHDCLVCSKVGGLYYLKMFLKIFVTNLSCVLPSYACSICRHHIAICRQFEPCPRLVLFSVNQVIQIFLWWSYYSRSQVIEIFHRTMILLSPFSTSDHRWICLVS